MSEEGGPYQGRPSSLEVEAARLEAEHSALERQRQQLRQRRRWHQAQAGIEIEEDEYEEPKRPPNDLSVKETAGRLLRSSLFLLAHTATALVLIYCINLVHHALHWMGDPTLFGRIPISYAFDAMDAVILTTYVVYGAIDARRAFRE